MKIIIHGGFFSESQTNQEVKQAKQQALKDIVQAGHKYLLSHTALETVVYTVRLLEDCDLFNAGTGSQIQSDGKIRLSASLMDGKTQKFSGVINIEDVKNPICIAEKLMAFDDRVLSGKGAKEFATNNGVTYYNPETPQRRHEYEKKLSDSIRLGTVGCVALDLYGNLAAATSTGGKGFEMPGRVSDSATTAGNYANGFAAVSCTGVGEDIVSGSVASKIVTRVTDGLPISVAAEKTLDEMKPYDGFAGIIGISADGHIYHADTHPYMVWALHDDDVEVFD
ncbi:MULTISPECIES: isoaspartyl peptidase/L-asparaginase [unclassified Mucilaginibacter]|jgi:L-asparaginase|uniref:isoaspartyl peptidase/L-asparaginase n=1 Tax=unclassified Mucilaginibacter TaxID=2617802 RepID=UPI0008BBAA91|nr:MULTISPECIES: isoaspartyl peptidase/L-asparaginase [unclassified Mucilaginibacter]WDF78395.1 isoaspartyl peptidase/L-asparaginase [Mucilaginibacter sp. KACC 22773]SEP36700.1 L-asparaginase [Mucilaginibacter sp. OK283]